jgi:hypothetical protein
LEFLSGLYARSEDFRSDSVPWKKPANSILPFSFSTVAQIEEQLDLYSDAVSDFQSAQEGIDLSELGRLKQQYEDLYSRIGQHHLTLYDQSTTDQVAQAEAHRIHTNTVARSQFEAHLADTSPDPVKVGRVRAFHERWVRSRATALDELKQMFPLADDDRLCRVQYSTRPTKDQWNETRAFLGFATHYVREISRVLGIPVSYSLIPLAGASRIEVPLTNAVLELPSVYSPHVLQLANNYEGALVDCCQQIGAGLEIVREFEYRVSLVQALKILNSISQSHLQKLIPVFA